MKSYNTEDKATDALIWILSVLTKNKIPYQIVGGLAARIYRANRPIVDIDMYIPASAGSFLAVELVEYVTKPLMHYVEDLWDLEYFQITYRGQKIEIGLSPRAKIFDKVSNKWLEQRIQFSKSTSGVFNGVNILVIPKSELLAYKKILGREVDVLDIVEIEAK